MKDFHIPDLAKRYTQYDMIHIHTELPEFPASRTRLLCAFLQDSADNSPAVDGELYALAASLVQMGLDTHEMVSVTNTAKEKKAVRSRQLKVLAGDYFSSGFYQLLSQAGHIQMVGQLSAAICEVNRLKMTFYANMKQLKLSADEYMDQMVQIRTQLFGHFGQLMQDTRHRFWQDMLNGIARCEVLYGELDRCDDPEQFYGSWGFWHIRNRGSREELLHLNGSRMDGDKLQPLVLKYNIKGLLHDMLDNQVRSVWDVARQLGSERIMQELTQIGEPFLRLVRTPKVLEER